MCMLLLLLFLSARFDIGTGFLYISCVQREGLAVWQIVVRVGRHFHFLGQ